MSTEIIDREIRRIDNAITLTLEVDGIFVLIAIVPISEYNILGGLYYGIFNYS